MSDNELIAEFMGFEVIERMPISKESIYMQPYVDTSLSNPYFGPHRSEQMRFSASWDWLMPVVEAIGNIGTEANYPIDHPLFNMAGKILKGVDCSIFSPLPAVYLRVVEFIKWYNNQKQ